MSVELLPDTCECFFLCLAAAGRFAKVFFAVAGAARHSAFSSFGRRYCTIPLINGTFCGFSPDMTYAG